jgi:acyl-CoA thioester hydrolase
MDKTTFDTTYRDPARYKFWIDDQVRFNDLDILGHVNAVRANEYFTGAKTKLFRDAMPNWPHGKLVPVLKLNVMLYESEIHFPQKLDIGLCVEKFGNTSVTLVTGLFGDGTCLGLCRSLLVFIDNATRQPTAPDEETKQKFLTLAA